MRRTFSFEIDDRQWAWLQDAGKPAATLRRLVDHAIRDDILRRALRDERHVELLIRRHHRQLERRFRAEGAVGDSRTSLRDIAEKEVLNMCEAMQDVTMRAAAVRLWLRFGIERGRVADKRAARARLQQMREKRPGGWREVLTDRPT